MEITIHDAFAKCKILKKRIPQKINSFNPTVYYKNSNKKINGKDIKDVEKQIKSDYQSIQDDIRLLGILNSKIAQSNAITTILIGDKKYTITEALAIKNSLIEHQQNLLTQLSNKYNTVNRIIENKNELLEDKADRYITDTFGSEENQSKEALDERQEYIDRGMYMLLDPIDADKQIRVIDNEIDEFISNIDSALNVSNATTFIVIE